jgi:hypothetical protein
MYISPCKHQIGASKQLMRGLFLYYSPIWKLLLMTHHFVFKNYLETLFDLERFVQQYDP